MEKKSNDITAIKVENVSKNFGSKTILNNVNLEVKQGELFGIIGTSGGGKTTLLKAMVGFVIPDKGDVKFKHGLNYDSVFKNSNAAKRTIAFVPQEPSFYLKLKVQENIEHFGAIYGMPREERRARAEKLLKMVNLYNFKDVISEKLSGGMRKRLGLLTATVHNPDIYVLDEPTADLDPYSRKQVMGFIQELINEGKTVIIASHLLEDLENMCDKVAIINKGEILKIDTPAELKKHFSPEKEIRIETKTRDYKELLEEIDAKKYKIKKAKVEGQKLIIKTEEAEKLLEKILSITKKDLIDINITSSSLNQVFDKIVLGEEE